MSVDAVSKQPQNHPFKRAAVLWALVLGLMWLLVFINWVVPMDLRGLGVESRSLTGLLPGVLLTPLLHAGAGHLASNMIPLALMGTVAALRDWRGFWIALGIIIIVSGLGVWLIGPSNTVTVGASGVVFGFFGYLVGRGIFVRQLGDILLAAVVVIIYGSLVWGIFPQDSHVSWQAHLCGLIGGVLASFVLAKRERAIVATQRESTSL